MFDIEAELGYNPYAKSSSATPNRPSPLAQLYAAWQLPPELESTAFLSMLALISSMQVSQNPAQRLKLATDQFHQLFPQVNEAQRFFEHKLRLALIYLLESNQPSTALELLKTYRQLPQFESSEIQLLFPNKIPSEWRERFAPYL